MFLNPWPLYYSMWNPDHHDYSIYSLKGATNTGPLSYDFSVLTNATGYSFDPVLITLEISDDSGDILKILYLNEIQICPL